MRNISNHHKIILVAGIIIIALAAVVFNTVKEKQDSNNEPAKQVLEQQAAELEAQAKNLAANAATADKYNLYLKLASVKFNLGLYPEAIAALDQIRDANQGNSRIWATYANIYRDMKDLAQAKENIKRALELDSENEGHWLVYLELSSDIDKNDQNDLYQEALRKTSNHIDIVVTYAKFLETSGDKNGAIAQWQKAGQLHPSKKAAYDAEIGRLRQQ